MKKIIIGLMVFLTLNVFANVTNIDKMELKGSEGGYLDDKEWSINDKNGKVRLILYVDPDEQEKGESFKPTTFELEELYKKEIFDIEVILNLGATWIPNMMIMKKLKDKAEVNPRRTFIVDKDEKFVKLNGFVNDEYNIILLDKNMKILFEKSGELNNEDIGKIKGLIKNNI